MEVTAVVIVLVIFNVAIVSSQDFAYHGPTGPEYWPELWPIQCDGKNQSPIDIKSEKAVSVAFSPVVLNGYDLDDTPEGASMLLINNGHSVQINLNGDYHMEGGPLSSVYQTEQIHFHWGRTDDQGSEHRIDGKQYSAEIHVVHYDRENFDSFDDAVLNNGLSVFGILIEITEDHNPGFDAVIQALKAVSHRGETYDFPEVFPITGILPSDKDQREYFFYFGSLTTPVCNEVVQWIVFKQPVSMSQDQINEFRTTIYENEVLDDDILLIDNFRPTQELNGRLVYAADASVCKPSLLATLGFAVSVLLLKQGTRDDVLA